MAWPDTALFHSPDSIWERSRRQRKERANLYSITSE